MTTDDTGRLHSHLSAFACNRIDASTERCGARFRLTPKIESLFLLVTIGERDRTSHHGRSLPFGIG
jgi:hypothetical protein